MPESLTTFRASDVATADTESMQGMSNCRACTDRAPRQARQFAPRIGNQAALRRLQAKLTVGAVNDPLEQEADEVADRVMRMADPRISHAAPPMISRKCAECEQEEKKSPVRRKESGSKAGAEAAPPIVDAVLASPGQPLDPSMEQFMGSRFGGDFSDVRIHTDAQAAESAAAVGARAYTVGRNIVFGQGQYDPAGHDGRRLLAHELAHVVQQGDGRADFTQRHAWVGGILQRDANARSSATELPVAPAHPDSSGTADKSEPDVTLVFDRVERIVVSCDEKAIAFETKSLTYAFPLVDCETKIPEGDYVADVRIDKKRKAVALNLNVAGNKHLFRSRFVMKKGQANPIDLLKDQDSVPVRYGATSKSPNRPQECLVRLEPQTLFQGGGDTVDLTKYLPKVPKLEWPLAEFGIADVVLRLGITASAKAKYSYNPGVINEICLTPTIRNPFAGHAKFACGGEAHLHFDVAIGAEVAAEVLGFDVLTAHGELKLDLDAAVKGDIAADINLEYHPESTIKSGKRFQLKTDIEMAALSAIGANLSGSAGVDFLGFSLWEGHAPKLLTGNLAYGWTGGLVFNNSFIPEPTLGTFAKATSNQLTAGALRTTGPKRPAKKDEKIPIKELVESGIKDSSGETKQGWTCEDGLPIHWFKPREGFYPRTITFNAANTSPTTVNRDAGPTSISHEPVIPRVWDRTTRSMQPGDPITGPTPIGVPEQNWPKVGDCFEYTPGNKRRTESEALRNLLKGLDSRYDGYTIREGALQVDHVRDLQFGGEDQINNLWPFDASANQSAGQLHQAQVQAYEKLLGSVERRHFVISSIGLDPDKAKRLTKKK